MSILTLNGLVSSASDDGEKTLSKDDVFHLLQNSRRRDIVKTLHECEHMHKSELAETVAALENETTVDQLSCQERKRVVVSLTQSHLPKMEDYGVIKINHDKIELGPNADQLLEYVETDTRSWI